ncbi:MAG: pilus assembly protein PilM, partial [Candidatus Berkelbacteria bacterium]|nr:pilus assembly protein PilM [Candidatus Berkelbacteria bacterium]
MSIFGKITGLDRDIFGLDVGHESIKVVQLKKAGSLFRLKSYGDSPCPKEPFSKDSIKDKKELSIAIKKAVTDHRISAKQLVSALPESYVFSKIIQMP